HPDDRDAAAAEDGRLTGLLEHVQGHTVGVEADHRVEVADQQLDHAHAGVGREQIVSGPLGEAAGVGVLDVDRHGMSCLSGSGSHGLAIVDVSHYVTRVGARLFHDRSTTPGAVHSTSIYPIAPFSASAKE